MNLDAVPEWSGMFLERDEVGYLEISDSDDRLHRPPPGWTLATIDECPQHSSQIFRYVRSEPTSAPAGIVSFDQAAGLMVALCATGVSVLAQPLIRAMLATKGIV